MQGLVFQVLETCYVDAFGSESWFEVVAAADAQATYSYAVSYPDAELGRLVVAIAAAHDLSPEQALRWFGQHAIPHFRAYAPQLFERYRACWPFLRSLNDIIHPEVRNLYPGADVPDFEYPLPPGAEHVIVYRSPRRLCALAEGLMLGAAAHFGETLVVTQSRCMHQGDDHCRFELSFSAV